MGKALRLSEKWFQRGLWLVAVVFAFFLIGLGGQVVRNIDLVEAPLSVEQFIDPVQAKPLRAQVESARQSLQVAGEQVEQAQLQLEVASNAYRNAREKFENWLRTREATARPEQDAELVQRTRELDTLKAAERSAQAQVERLRQAQLDAQQSHDRAQRAWAALEEPAVEALARESRQAELRVFAYRLLLTLPLLAGAAWLFVKKRHGMYWPFVWGFIFFALFAFFVELVPYLPSYGGYVRYAVGIAVTVLVGRYVIVALQAYLARQKEVEALPDEARRETLNYDLALTRIGRGVCPGCERHLDFKDATLDYCPHCGIAVCNRCEKCSTRKGAFLRFCYSCGTPARAAA